MKRVTARYGKPKGNRLSFLAMSKMSDEYLLSNGELFFLDPDPTINKVPLVRLFGPGHYWRMTMHPDQMFPSLPQHTSKPFEIVGEGSDGANHEQWLLIIQGRRKGEIYGKWFSSFCRQGELGVHMAQVVEPISELQFTETIQRLGSGS